MTVALRPQPGAAREYNFPEFKKRQFSNGLNLIVAPIHQLPIVTMFAVTDAGAGEEPKGKEGVALLTARALSEGARSIDGEAFTEQLERLGTSLDADADWDATTVSMTVLTEKLDDAFARFVDVLTAADFPAPAIDRLKGERLAEILQVESEPREYANEMFARFAYAKGSRFGVPAGGTRESVSSLTRQDVLDFYASRYRPGGTTLIMVGDVTVEKAASLVEQALSDWSGSVSQTATADDAPSSTTRSVQIVERNDAPQSEVRVGHVGVPRHHPDYFKITVMNAILGGLFGSRVNLNLREVHGYTYGARSMFDWRRAAGPFVISTAVASDVTGPAVKETLYEVNRMCAEPVSEQELSLATNYLDGVFPIRYETTDAVAHALATLVIYNLPDDWYDTYRSNIRAVTAEDVLNAASQHIHPDQLQIVVVGDKNVIQQPLEALDVGPIVVHNE
jgi:zinc protease